MISFHEKPLTEGHHRIHARAVASARRYLVAEADLLESIMEADRARTYEEFGWEALTPYCINELGLSGDVAAVFVRVARKSAKVPELHEAVISGDLCISKAKTIVPVINSRNQTEWIDKAKTMSKRRLELEVAIASPVGAKPEAAKVKATTMRVEFELTHEQMEEFRRAQDIVSRSSRKAASLAETHIAMTRGFLEKNDPVRKAERAAKKPDRSRDRSTKGVPASVVHAVNRRDRGRCQARTPDGTICGSSRWTDHHHIVPKSLGGADTLENLITLCAAHHRLWHRKDHPPDN